MPTDYQGNCYSVTDELGNVVERYSFDPWGRRRNPADWTFNNVQSTYTFDRGYTGHEMLDAFSLINMNGRVYDPIIARFLSPDNYVQAPESSQGFNRYSYCLNNPLKYTDPSGEFLAIPFFAMAFTADFISNNINGWPNPAGLAYNNAMNSLHGMSNCAQFPIYQNSNTIITAGLDPFNLGVSVNAQYTNGDFTFRGKAGIGVFSGPSLGGGIGYSSRDFHVGLSGGYSNIGPSGGWYAGGGASVRTSAGTFGYAGTFYGGDNSQYVSELNYSKGDFSFRLNEDYPFGDKFRTGGFEIGVGPFSFGGLVYTNDPKGEKDVPTKENISAPIWGPNTGGNTTWTNGQVLFAPAYVGLQYGNSIDRIGYSASVVQNILQNGAHHIFHAQNYYLNYENLQHGSYGLPFYSYNGYNNPYSIY